jgi:hypothetical protein
MFYLQKVDESITRLNYEEKGFIDFRISEDLLIWDCYTYKSHRGQGVFKILLEELNNQYPNKIFCVAVANKKLVPYLEKIGYKKTMDSLPYWGRPSNCVVMKKS